MTVPEDIQLGLLLGRVGPGGHSGIRVYGSFPPRLEHLTIFQCLCLWHSPTIPRCAHSSVDGSPLVTSCLLITSRSIGLSIWPHTTWCPGPFAHLRATCSPLNMQPGGEPKHMCAPSPTGLALRPLSPAPTSCSGSESGLRVTAAYWPRA